MNLSLLKDQILIMGILNTSPDSFYNNYNLLKKNYSSLYEHFFNANIIDVGGESTRPGANAVSLNIELDRIKKILPFIEVNKNKIFSIDTYKPKVATLQILDISLM